jgi:hypothetical protein
MVKIAHLGGSVEPLQQARLLATRSRSERAEPGLLAELKARLDGRGWVRRRILCAELGIKDDRLRSLARYSNGEIVGSSAKGYCLTRQAAVEDVSAVIGETLSRSKQLRARVSEVLKVLHGRPLVPADITSDKPVHDGLGGVA